MTAPSPNSLTFFETTGTYYAVADPSVSGTINDPIVQAVSGLVSFTPRLPKGFQTFVKDYLVQAAYNGQQTVSIIGNPVQGNWQLNYQGQLTAVMPYNVTPAALQTALQALSTIGTGNVLVSQGINPQSYNCDFTGTLAANQIEPMVPSWTNLTDANGYDCTITVAVTAQGGPQIVADTSISIPTRQARIWSGVLSTIDYVDTPGVMLTANSPALNLPAAYSPLIYDVAYSAVTFNNQPQVMGNVAFQAPTDNTGVCITSPDTALLNYETPNNALWTPNQPTLAVVTNWRHRAGAVPTRIAG